ncbi:hypothetical protein VNN37_07575 [Lactococcus garvieae]|uniref:DUF1016 N-terminal domain-containing protein n=1 Tax=Lactococcus garvieae TaxID=1363 RepID=UPI0030D2C5AC
MIIENQDLAENNSQILFDTQNIIKAAQNNSILSVGFERVQIYWKIGERIVVEEQDNKEHAEYGKFILKKSRSKIIKNLW